MIGYVKEWRQFQGMETVPRKDQKKEGMLSSKRYHHKIIITIIRRMRNFRMKHLHWIQLCDKEGRKWETEWKERSCVMLPGDDDPKCKKWCEMTNDADPRCWRCWIWKRKKMRVKLSTWNFVARKQEGMRMWCEGVFTILFLRFSSFVPLPSFLFLLQLLVLGLAEQLREHQLQLSLHYLRLGHEQFSFSLFRKGQRTMREKEGTSERRGRRFKTGKNGAKKRRKTHSLFSDISGTKKDWTRM